MKIVLFIMLPFPSHYFVAFGTANYLKNDGYRVVFTGNEDNRMLVENEGFEFQSMNYILEYRKLVFKTWFALFLKTILDKSFTRLRYKEFYGSIISLDKLIKRLEPKLIFIDHHLGEYAMFLKKYDIKLAILNTKLSCYQSTGIPPLGVGWVSKNNAFDNIRASVDWFVLSVRNRIKILIEASAFIGKSDKFFLKKYAKKNSIIWSEFFEENSSTYNIVRNIPKLITYPKCIEYPFKKSFSDEFYIETPFKKSEFEYLTDEYKAILEKILEKKKLNKDVKLVYCALGTISNNSRKRADILLSKILAVINSLNNIQFVLAVNEHLITKSIKTDNIYILKKIPQLHILQFTDLMITHGGLNSISECIQAQVPMLSFPLIKNVDHFGNSARVEANGFGLKADIEKDSISMIENKILSILNNQYFRNTLSQYKEEVEMSTKLDLFFNRILQTNSFSK